MSGYEDEEFMDTSDTPWYWYYMGDCGRWHRFEDDPDSPFRSEVIEEYYLRNPKGALTSSSHRPSKIDFAAMLQTDLKTGKARQIQRSFNIKISCSCFIASPALWEKVDPKCPYQLIPVSESTPEYQTVANYVKTDGLLDRYIVSISRIQNLDLFELFCRKKKHLMRIHGVNDIQERRLFHGTKIENVDTICKYNFDARLPRQNGRVYGHGIYFAIHASHADKYSMSSTDPLPPFGGRKQPLRCESTKIIFLARVMIGTPVAGQRDFLKPDHGMAENSHDSCVDDIRNPKIFVIFDPNQIYPEYLIQYK
ncbi:protein mono-ADP-ribosyltransferase PARP11 [Halichoeres trimaculatus]|uniref:protein mono-ADP-ribosyltransferase PARP11 n=1 Tax=Halichoeres trimaculatus TaxID=147232 RepID=UPI003D9DC55F